MSWVDVVRALFVDDSEDDVLLAAHAIRRAGVSLESSRVDHEEALLAALATGTWDVVVVDHSLPSFDGMHAARVARAHDPELPVVLLSGVLEETRAVEAMRVGICDFVSKSNLTRLGPALVRETAARRARLRARSETRRARAESSALSEVVPMPLAVVDDLLQVRSSNPAFREAFRDAVPLASLRAADAPELAIGPRLRAAVHDRCVLSALEVVEASASEDRPAPRAFLLDLRPIDDAERLSALSLYDVTRAKQLEAQAVAAQRLEAIGRLVGGIAHDFNNMLGVIHATATAMHDEFPTGSVHREDVEAIIDATARSARLISQLLAFSRTQPRRPRSLDLGGIMSGLQPMIARMLGEDVRVELSLGAGPHRVRADVSQLEQIVVNLAVNARDAMPGGGRLELGVTAETIDVAGRDGTVPPGRYVVLSVTDTGSGIPKQFLERIYEPFFTTKTPDRGTGLGLSTVYGIVKQSGGFITVHSHVGRGTRFELRFPAGSELDTPISSSMLASVSPGPVEAERILVVEDQELLRRATRRILRRRGYEVVEAADGAEAMARAEERSIDVLITDLVMPGGNGVEVAARITERHPAVRVIFMSGYASHAVVEAVPPGAVFLPKPFDEAALLRALEAATAALDADSG